MCKINVYFQMKSKAEQEKVCIQKHGHLPDARVIFILFCKIPLFVAFARFKLVKRQFPIFSLAEFIFKLFGQNALFFEVYIARPVARASAD